MVRIFRIQDKDGRGPWKPGFSHKWVRTRPDHDHLLPTWKEFPGFLDKILPNEHVGCGCQSLKQLRRWIKRSEYKTLQKYGYQCVCMDADRIIEESNTQCLFGRTKPLNKDFKTIKLYW